MLNGSSDRNRAQLWGSEGWFGLKDSSHGIWAFFQFSNQLAAPMILLGAITADWFSWGIYQTVRLESMTRFGFTQITPCIDEAIGCNWSLETPKGESIETYSTFWRIQVCKQIAKLLCLQTGRVATWKGDAVMLVFSLSRSCSLLSSSKFWRVTTILNNESTLGDSELLHTFLCQTHPKKLSKTNIAVKSREIRK